MPIIGVFLAGEEHSASRLVDVAAKAEQAGFGGSRPGGLPALLPARGPAAALTGIMPGTVTSRGAS